MLIFEKTFQIQVRSRWTIFEILLTSTVNCTERILRGKEIVNISSKLQTSRS